MERTPQIVFPRGSTPKFEEYFRIRVIGVGGGGCSAVSRMSEMGMSGIRFAAVDTDAQALALCRAGEKQLVGEEFTHGHGAGGDPAIGAKAARASAGELVDLIEGADMVFLISGLGGGTGSGVTPVLARMAREAWAFTLAIVSRPFSFEGTRRRAVAGEALGSLRREVETLITVSGDRLLETVDRPASIRQVLGAVDDLLRLGVRDVTALLLAPGILRVDYHDLRHVLAAGRDAYVAAGQSAGEDSVVEAAKVSMASPLLEGRLDGARGILLVVTGSPCIPLCEVGRAAETVQTAVRSDARFMFGTVTDTSMPGQVRVTLVATGSDLAA